MMHGRLTQALLDLLALQVLPDQLHVVVVHRVGQLELPAHLEILSEQDKKKKRHHLLKEGVGVVMAVLVLLLLLLTMGRGG